MSRSGSSLGAGAVRGLLAGLGLALLTGLGILWAYQHRAPWSLNVGEIGDAPFVSGAYGSGFYGDEPDLDYRYRWSSGHAVLTFPDLGEVSAPLLLTLRVQGYRPPPEPPPVLTVTLNGAWQTAVPLTTSLTTVALGPATGYPPADALVVTLDSPTFRPPGDPRDLGVKVDRVTVGFAGPVPWIWPPGGVLGAGVVAVLGLFALLWRLLGGQSTRAQLAGALVGGLLGVAVLLGGLLGAGLLTTWALGPLAGVLGVAGVGARAWPWLRGWPAWVDRLADPKGYAAPGLLFLLLAGYALFALGVLPQVDWIGHADYADNAVVARNLAAGRGYVVDYVAQFYRAYPGVTHPADTWPLLQPTLIAPFFALLGAQTWVARLPNLLMLLGLAGAVYAFGSRWWDRRVGLLGAAFTLFHPYFFQTILYPINDLAFTLLAFLTLGCVWEAVRLGEQRRGIGDRGWGLVESSPGSGAREQGAGEAQNLVPHTSYLAPDTSSPTSSPQPPAPAVPPLEAQLTGLDMQLAQARAAQVRAVRRWLLAAGIAAGLLIWSKPTAVALLLGLAGALWLRRRLTRWAGRAPGAERPTPGEDNPPPHSIFRIPQWLWFGLPLALVLLPLIVRNLLAFGLPFFSTESYDTWILRFWPYDEWEKIYAVYTGPGRALPSPRLLLGGSFDNLLAAVMRGFQDAWTKGILGSDILAAPLVLLGATGWLLAPRRLYGLLGAWLAAFGAMELFILLYWHYEARYFLGLVPWLYLGLAAGVFWAWDRSREHRQVDALPRAPGRWALALLPLVVLLVLGPAWRNIASQADTARSPDPFAAAGRWLAANTPPDAVIMTREPWELNWYSQRKAVMIPWGSVADVRQIGQQYHVTYLWLGGPTGTARPQLGPLYQGKPLAGMTVHEVYRSQGDEPITIYQWQP